MTKNVVTLIRSFMNTDFFRFCVVGAGGFIINATLLFALHKKLGLNIFFSQLIASEIALLINFVLHNKWTYKARATTKTVKELIVQFHVTSWVAIVGSSVLVSVLSNQLKIQYMISLAVASIIAMAWNFIWTKYFVWKKHHHEESASSNET